MIKQLRRKFVAINMVIVTAVLLVMFSFLYVSTRRDLEQQSIHMMQSVMPEDQRRGERFDPGDALDDLFDDDDDRRPQRGRGEILLPYFTLREQNGVLTASGNGAYDLEDTEFLAALTAAVAADGKQVGVLEQYDLRYCLRSSPMGSFTVFADMSSEQATLSGLLKTCALVGGISFAAFLGISFLLARWAVRPVEQAWEQQRQFVADASHELKTPLTVITTNAELLKAPDSTEAERGRFVDSILTMSAQMRGLVEGLLELARVDNGTAKMTFEPLNFSELAEDALLPFEPVFFEKGLTLDSEIAEGITLTGSRQHLKQVIDILLDNAQKYACEGAEVKVTLARQDKGHCLLTVANQGEPIAPEDLKQIFRRFYRVDKARSMNHSYGLGLSIAQSIVQEHQGKIWAESCDGWNVFLVRLDTQV
jgi:signal transduction histidine kinase